MIVRELVNKISFKVDQSGFRKAESLIASYKNKMKGLVQDQRNMLKSEDVATRAVVSNLTAATKATDVVKKSTNTTTKAIQTQTKAVKTNSSAWENSTKRRANEIRKLKRIDPSMLTGRDTATLALADRYSSRGDKAGYAVRERIEAARAKRRTAREQARDIVRYKAQRKEAFYNLRNTAAVGMAAAGLPIAYGAKSGLDYSLNIEKEKMVMGGIMGDKAKGAALAQTLVDYANKTVLETEPVLRTAKALMMSGVSSDKVQGIITSLGNATAGDSDKMYGGARQLGQIKGNTYAKLQDLNIMVDNDIPIKQALVKTLGVSEKKMLDMISKRQVSYEAVVKALASINPGMLDLMGETNWGKIQMMKDALTTLAGSMVDVWMPTIKAVTEAVTALANTMKKLPSEGKVAIGAVTAIVLAIGGIVIPAAFAVNQIWQLVESMVGLAAAAKLAREAAAGGTTTTTAPTFDKAGKPNKKSGKSPKMEVPKLPTPRRNRMGGGRLSRIASTSGGMGMGGLLSRAMGPFFAMANVLGTEDTISGASVDRMREFKASSLNSTSSKNIQTTININDLRVPEGTTAQQKQSFVDSAKRIFNQEFQSFMAGAVSNTGGI